MSRLDYVTISIVVICLIALGFLVFKTIGLMTADPAKKKQQTTQLADDSDVADTYEDIDSLSTEDLDDDEVTGVLDDPESDISEDDLAEDAADLNAGGTTSDEDYSDDKEEETRTYDDDDKDEEAVAPARPASYNSGKYLVIAGSFSKKIGAERRVKELKSEGFNNARVGKLNAAYAIALVDQFDSKSKAQELMQEVKNKGFEVRLHEKK